MSPAHKQSKHTKDLLRNARLDVAEERQKQQVQMGQVDALLSLLGEASNGGEHDGGSTSDEDLRSDGPCEFRGLRELREQVDEYTALVQRIVGSAERSRTSNSSQRQLSDSFVEEPRSNPADRTGLHEITVSGLRSGEIHSGGHLAMTNATTVQILPQSLMPESALSVPMCCCGNASHIKPHEVLSAARQSVKNQRVHSASEHGSLMQLLKPASSSLQPPHPFLSQAGPGSYSLHAAAQNVLGSIKRTVPDFHKTAAAIMKSDVTDMVSAFAVALRHYDDRMRSRLKLLLQNYDSTDSSARRSELVCEIDHLHKIIRSASNIREQVVHFILLKLLDIVHAPYYQGVSCPPLRQLKILQTAFSSGQV